MIRSFRHAGLGLLYHSGLPHGVPPARAQALQELLALIDVAEDVHDLALPGLQVLELHREPVVAVSLAWQCGYPALPGHCKRLQTTWCLTLFCFQGDAFEVNLFDFH